MHNKEDLKDMGERVREIRNDLNLTKEALARELGVSGQFIGIVENGNSEISYDKLKKLCDLSGHSADYILFGRNPDAILKAKYKLQEFDQFEIQDACAIILKIATFIKNHPDCF